MLAMISDREEFLTEELLNLPNNLCLQSYQHSDGWGFAHFEKSGLPKLYKSIKSAHSDGLYENLARLVRSSGFLAHIRRATVGRVCLANAHPFQQGMNLFAHNGHIQNFSQAEEKIAAMIPPSLRHLRAGQTDSEALFLALMGFAGQKAGAFEPSNLSEGLAKIQEVVGPFSQFKEGENIGTSQFTFILLSAKKLIAFNGGRALYIKTVRPDEEGLHQPFSQRRDSLSENKVLVSSEIIGDPNQWLEIPFGNLMVVEVGRAPLLRKVA
jgi:predicted glutamine amidotransferase